MLLHTGGDAHGGKEAYAHQAPYVTAVAADWLADSTLMLERLTDLAAIPARGARLHAAPLAWRGVGTWPVRAYAIAAR